MNFSNFKVFGSRTDPITNHFVVVIFVLVGAVLFKKA